MKNPRGSTYRPMATRFGAHPGVTIPRETGDSSNAPHFCAIAAHHLGYVSIRKVQGIRDNGTTFCLGRPSRERSAGNAVESTEHLNTPPD